MSTHPIPFDPDDTGNDRDPHTSNLEALESELIAARRHTLKQLREVQRRLRERRNRAHK